MKWARLALAAIALWTVTLSIPATASDGGVRAVAMIPKPVFRARTQTLEHADRSVPDLLPQYMACMSLLKQQRYGAADLTCSRLQLLDPHNASAYRMHGVVELGRKKYGRARAEFRQAIALDPNSSDGYALLASAYREEGRYRQALTYFTVAIRMSPDDGRLWNARCWTRALAGVRLSQAMSDCRRSFRLAISPYTLDSMGFIALRQARYRSALNYYEGALTLDASLPTSLFGRGVAKLRLTGTASARADIVSALALDGSVGDVFVKAHLIDARSPLLHCGDADCSLPKQPAPGRGQKRKKAPASTVQVTRL